MDGMLVPTDDKLSRLVKSMRRNLGPMIGDLIEDPDVVEILLNADGNVWADRLTDGLTHVGTLQVSAAEAFIRTVAGHLNIVITTDSPIISGELPFKGARFEATIPPITSAPAFAMRFKALRVHSLADYEAAGILTRSQRLAIQGGIEDRLNIVIAGSTGSGKTTLANALLDYVGIVRPNARVLILEDTIELQCRLANTLAFRATGTVDQTRLLKSALRYRPDMLIIGEVRGGEALAMLKAWNTGHDGLCTAHAGTARNTLLRIEQMVLEVAATPMQATIGSTVGMIVVIAKTPAGRRVTEVVRVNGFVAGDYLLDPLGE